MNDKMLSRRWKEFGGNPTTSIKDDFSSQKYDGQDKVASYLDSGFVKLLSLDVGKDIFTGEIISSTKYIATDGEYTYPNTLSYYVRKYNLRLPKEFENKILKNGMKNEQTS